jgi:hypothetical protein
MMVNGRMIRGMAKAFIPMEMDKNMMGNIRMA